MLRAIPRQSSDKPYRKAGSIPRPRGARISLPQSTGLTAFEFHDKVMRAFLTYELLAADGYVAVMAKNLKRNRTDLYKLLRKHAVPVDDVRLALGFDVDARERRTLIERIVRDEFRAWTASKLPQQVRALARRCREYDARRT